MKNVLLKCDGVSVERGNRFLLSGVSFSVSEGECILLRGPNGLGKTSLLRTIVGLQTIIKGTIDSDDDTTVYSSHADGMKSTLTVEENMSFWKTIYQSGCDLDEILEKYNLNNLRKRYAGQLSAGQKRRLGLSRLSISERKVWVMDEPTVSLDKNAVSEFIKIIKSHLDGGGACLAVTHIDIGVGEQSSELDLSQFIPKKENKDMLSEDPFL